MGYQGWLATNALALFCVMRLSATMILTMQDKQDQGWGEYWTYEYEYWKISTRVVLEYNIFCIFMFIILG